MGAPVVLASPAHVNYEVAMFTCDATPGPGGFLTYVLRSGEGTAECHVVPERGALTTRLRFGSDEVLFLDEATLSDRGKNVRGGIPVLFPMAGRLPNDSYDANGRSYTLAQHGFARKLPWLVIGHGGESESAWLTCRLESSGETLAVFPWTFRLELTFTLTRQELQLDVKLTNTSPVSMPHALGFHPYFHVPAGEKRLAGLRTDAKRGFDNTTGQAVYVTKIDFTVPELDLHLLDHSTHGTIVRRGSLPKLGLTWDEGFRTLVLWTLAGRGFVCVEPWEAPAGALASGKELPWLPTRTTVTRMFRIASGIR
jgi:galactose mutarotase-like enzyme